MKRKFQIDGIGCGGCVARVKKVLDANPAIEKTEISLNPKGATIISMKEELSVDDLQRQLDELGGYTIKEIN
ncbi:heavy-metal-associated domain-containing protein [Arenibacter palladensis]|uniref:heavy-metal-associated domain-containing protein n=1 Tax=Arenibacter palladensis TaxID=237373 RepID=UPI002FD560EE